LQLPSFIILDDSLSLSSRPKPQSSSSVTGDNNNHDNNTKKQKKKTMNKNKNYTENLLLKAGEMSTAVENERVRLVAVAFFHRRHHRHLAS
jgi:hypothetical protein